MKNIVLPLCIIFVCLFFKNRANAQLRIIPETRFYWINAGQELKFLVENTNSDSIKYAIKYGKGSNFRNLKSGSLASFNNKATIPFLTTEAGFYRCEAIRDDTVATTIAIDPFNIEPAEHEPTDFDAYWQNQKKQVNAIPLSTNFSFHSSTDYVEIYNFNIDITDGKKAFGYFCIPKQLNGAKVPAIIELPAFGHIPNIISTDASMAERGGVLYIKLNVHNNPPTEAGPPEYITTNITDPDNYYLKYAMQGVIKTIDYLQKTRSNIDFNGQVGVMGMSQGGGLAMLAAGIDTRISLLMAMYPALCEHSGEKYDKPSGFPYYYRNIGNPAFPTVQYYDAVNTLKRFKGHSWIALAYNDVISPPATVAAAFNQIQGQKILQHEITKEHLFGVDEFFDTNLQIGIYALIRQYFPEAKAPWPYNPTTTAYEVNIERPISAKTPNNIVFSGKVKVNNTINTSFPVFWEKISGPGNVTFSEPRKHTTTVAFSQDGVYRLRLIAQDTTELTRHSKFFQIVDEITVNAKTSTLLPVAVIEKNSLNFDPNNIVIYPNPTSNNLYLSTIETTDLIEVYDILGKLCLSQTNYSAEGPLSIGHLPNGIYTVFVKNKKNIVGKRIVKK